MSTKTRNLMKALGVVSILSGIHAVVVVLLLAPELLWAKILYVGVGVFSFGYGALVFAHMPPPPGRNPP